MALLCRLGLFGFPQRSLATDTLRTRKFWRLPSNAPNATAARMMVFNTGNPANSVIVEGAVTADSSGNFDLDHNTAIAATSKTLAVAHNWNGSTGTANIVGGPGIATLNEVPL